jgi:membrane-bound lytic murein transglycosylase MltF
MGYRRFGLAGLCLMLCAAALPAAAQQPARSKEGVALLDYAGKPRAGDLDAMVKRGTIRVLTTVSLGQYYINGIEQSGVTYELMQRFEKYANRQLKQSKTRDRIQIVMIPVARDDLLPALIGGRGDIAAARLTETAKRHQRVDFSLPLKTGVNELVVTGPAAPGVKTFDDLAEVAIHVRPSSAYYESLIQLDARRRAGGKRPLQIVPADERLEDEDLLEMVNAGLFPAAVADDYVARFWTRIYDGLVVHDDLTLRRDGEIAWAIRKDSPQLKALVDGFVPTVGEGTAFNGQLTDRYLKSTKWVTNALGHDERQRFTQVVDFLKTYSDQFGFDWLMIGAQGYQESRLDQSARSQRGAVGVMQMLPSTAADESVSVRNIEVLENNIHAGVKYLNLLRKTYFDEPALSPADKVFFSFAAYNAGPGGVAKARRKAKQMGLDPNVWFDNVEIAAGRTLGREPVQYVRNIFKYYVAYSQVMAGNAGRKAAQQPQ